MSIFDVRLSKSKEAYIVTKVKECKFRTLGNILRKHSLVSENCTFSTTRLKLLLNSQKCD